MIRCAPLSKEGWSSRPKRWRGRPIPRTSRSTPAGQGNDMAEIDALFREMTAMGGSDLHLEEGRKPKARVNGDLQDLPSPALSGERMRELLGELAGRERWEKFEETGDLDFAYSMGDEARFRANYLRQFTGYGAVF